MKPATAPIRDRPVRIAFAGCGRIATKHIASILQHHERARLVALCDPLPERLAAASGFLADQAAEAGLAIETPSLHTNYTELLDGNHRADLVVLATPSGLRLPGRSGCRSGFGE